VNGLALIEVGWSKSQSNYQFQSMHFGDVNCDGCDEGNMLHSERVRCQRRQGQRKLRLRSVQNFSSQRLDVQQDGRSVSQLLDRNQLSDGHFLTHSV